MRNPQAYNDLCKPTQMSRSLKEPSSDVCTPVSSYSNSLFLNCLWWRNENHVCRSQGTWSTQSQVSKLNVGLKRGKFSLSNERVAVGEREARGKICLGVGGCFYSPGLGWASVKLFRHPAQSGQKLNKASLEQISFRRVREGGKKDKEKRTQGIQFRLQGISHHKRNLWTYSLPVPKIGTRTSLIRKEGSDENRGI